MSPIMPLENVRRQIREVLTQLGAAEDATAQESMLIHDGFFCGRRFEIDGLAAVWFHEECQIKFYDRAGQLLKVDAPASRQLVTDRKAA